MKTSKKRVSTKKKEASKAAVQEAALDAVTATPVIDSVRVPVAATPGKTEETRIVPQDLAIKQPVRLVFVAFLLGWLFDFLFWEQSFGVNFAIFLILALIGGLIVLVPEGHRPAGRSLWLLAPFLFFGVVSFLRQESLTVFLAVTFALIAVGLLATSYLSGRWYLYRLSNYVHKFFVLMGDLVARPLLYFGQVRKASTELPKQEKSFPIAGIVRGLVIALPIVLCFGSLLASADLVFSQKLDEFFDTEKIFEYIQRTFIILFFAYILAAAFLHAAIHSKDENVTAESQFVIKPFLGFTEAAVILGSVALLFLIFVVVQFQYFFGGETNIGVAGYTYSQYARRGFNELVIVAFFSLVLILGLSTLTRREEQSQKKMYSGLSVAVVALVMVILVSAYQRISLGIDWHGFSRLRLYPRVFLIWLGILLLVVAILELLRRERYFALAAVLASVGFAVSLTFVNVDAAIVRHNVPRTLHGKNLNVAHLASLSVDAVPALAREFYSDAYPQRVHEGIGAALTCYLHRDSMDETDWSDWRSFNLSRWQAHVALQDVENLLQEYGVNDDSYWDVKVRTPDNQWYRCRYFETAQDD